MELPPQKCLIHCFFVHSLFATTKTLSENFYLCNIHHKFPFKPYKITPTRVETPQILLFETHFPENHQKDFFPLYSEK